MEKRKKPAEELSLAPALRQDLRLFSLLARPEEEFLGLEIRLEADPLFVRLLAPGPDGRAPLRRRRLPGASYAFFAACGDEALASAAAQGSAGEWLAERPAMLRLARKTGPENFEKYVLGGENCPLPQAARACGLSLREFDTLKTFAAAFIMAHEHTPPAALPPRLLRCAAEVRAEGGELRAAYTHPSYFRGSYSIDGRALAALLKSGVSRAEAAKLRSLAAAAQRLAWRKSGFHRALTALLDGQKDFLLGRGPLKPLSQRSLAAAVGLNPGTVSRLLSCRTVLTPAGDELPLKELFRRKNAYVIDRIKDILGGRGAGMTDAGLAAELKRRCGIRVSRRSVNLYRKKL